MQVRGVGGAFVPVTLSSLIQVQCGVGGGVAGGQKWRTEATQAIVIVPCGRERLPGGLRRGTESKTSPGSVAAA